LAVVLLFSESRAITNDQDVILHGQCRIYHCAYECLSTGPRWPGGLSSCQKNAVYMSDLI